MSGTLHQAPFGKRSIRVTIDIPPGTSKRTYNKGVETIEAVSFHQEGKGKRYLPFSNYRVDCSIVVGGNKEQPQAALQIYNMGIEKMRTLADYGNQMTFQYGSDHKGDHITVRIYAGSSSSDLTKVFEGIMIQCHADFSSAPDPFLFIQASASASLQLQPGDVISYKGDIEAATIIRQIAEENNLTFENNGVTAVLHNPYLSGDRFHQVSQCAERGNFDYTMDNNVLAIWPVGGNRRNFKGSPLKNEDNKTKDPSRDVVTGKDGKQFAAKGGFLVVSKQTGLIGYPTFSGSLLGIQTLFRNDLRRGDVIKVESDFFIASGYYNINTLSHHLSTEVNGGPWLSELNATRVGFKQGTQSPIEGGNQRG